MKKVFGFRVLLNDKIICRAGFKKESSVVSCIINSIRRKSDNAEELNINIGGLNSDTNEHVEWFYNSLQEGDKISIEIITDNFDAPTTIRKSKTENELIEKKIKHFYKLKEELKDHLTE